MLYRRALFALSLLLCLMAACAPAAPQIVIVPTLASLPSETPTPQLSYTPSLTFTPRPTLTPTENILETQVAMVNVTLAVFLTQNAVYTETAAAAMPVSASSLTPSLTITSTLPPTAAPPQVTPVLAQPVYVTRLANLRDCASRDCNSVLQIEAGNALLVTGTMQGDAITPGNPLWFQVDHFGQILFIYSELVSATPPTQAPATLAPPPLVIPTAAESFGLAPPPISVPQGGGSCPSTSATCGQLTCEQAYACLAAGNGRLDADDDGIPCESVCLGN